MVLWVAVAFTVLFAVFTFDGFFFYDDINYVRYAHQLAVGTFELTFDIHNHRFGLLLPEALFIRFFGVHEWSVLIWPLAATLLTLFVIYRFVYKRSRFAALLAVWLFGTEYYIIYFSNKVYPDTTDTLFMILGVMLLWTTRNSNPWLSVLPALAFFASLLTKETVIYAAPFLGWWIVSRFRKETDIKRNIIFIFFSLLFPFVLFNYYYFTTGDYFFLIDSVHNNHYIDRLSYFDKPGWAILKRLTYEPILMLCDSGMIGMVILALPKLLRGWRCLLGTKDNVESMAWVYTVSCLLMFWFMTTSFKVYNPIPLNPRMFFPVLPGMAILAAFSLKYYVTDLIWLRRYALLFLGAACIDILTNHEKIAMVYLAFAALFGMQWYCNCKLSREFLWTAILLLTTLHPLYGMLKRHPTDYFAEKRAFEYIKQHEGNLTILCDERLVNQADYYFEFDTPKHLRFLSYCDTALVHEGEVWVITNENTIQYLTQYGMQPCEPPIRGTVERLFEDHEVALYRLQTSTLVQHQELRATSE